MMRPLLAATGSLLIALGAEAQIESFADVAPADTVMFAHVVNMERAWQKIDRSALGDIWRHEQVQRFAGRLSEEVMELLDPQLNALGIELEDIQMPTGEVALAIILSEDDEDLGRILVLVDFGDRAGAMRDIADELIDDLVDDDAFTLVVDEYGDIETMRLTPVVDDIAGEDDELEDPFGPDGTSMFGSEYILAWHDSVLIAANTETTMHDAIDTLDGDEFDALSEQDEFIEAMNQRDPEADVTAYFAAAPFFEAAAELDQTADAVLGALGFDHFLSVTTSWSFDTPDALIEYTGGLRLREKTGLFAVLDSDDQPFDPPAAAGADASSVTWMSADFGAISDIVRDLLPALGEEDPETAGMMQVAFGAARPVIESLGTDLMIVENVTRPYRVDSLQQVLTLELQDDLAISSLLTAAVSNGVADMHDFEGNGLYASDLAPVAVGLGFSRVFIGQRIAVENSMRQSGRPDAARLATEARFEQARDALPEQGFLYTYTDTVERIGYLLWSLAHQEEIQRAEMMAMGMDEEQIDEFIEMMELEAPEWLGDMPDIEVFADHLGDMVAVVRSTPRGLEFTGLLLRR